MTLWCLVVHDWIGNRRELKLRAPSEAMALVRLAVDVPGWRVVRDEYGNPVIRREGPVAGPVAA